MGLLQVLPPRRVHRVVLLLLRLRRLHRRLHRRQSSPPPAPASGSPSAPAGLTATVEAGDESSTDSFRWDGDDEGADFKPNGSVSMYPLPTVGQFLPSPISSLPSCSRVSLESDPSSLLDTAPSSDDIILPPGLVSALHRAISPEAFVEGL